MARLRLEREKRKPTRITVEAVGMDRRLPKRVTVRVVGTEKNIINTYHCGSGWNGKEIN